MYKERRQLILMKQFWWIVKNLFDGL